MRGPRQIGEDQKKGPHVHRCRVSTENIGEDPKKVFVVRDEAPHLLRSPRLQPAQIVGESVPRLLKNTGTQYRLVSAICGGTTERRQNCSKHN